MPYLIVTAALLCVLVLIANPSLRVRIMQSKLVQWIRRHRIICLLAAMIALALFLAATGRLHLAWLPFSVFLPWIGKAVVLAMRFGPAIGLVRRVLQFLRKR